MKVLAQFPTACRDEQAVHAPPEQAERAALRARPERTSGWRASGTGPGSRGGARLQDDSGLLEHRRGRAFPSTRPHDGASSRGYGIGP